MSVWPSVYHSQRQYANIQMSRPQKKKEKKKKNYEHGFDKDLTKTFQNTYQFSHGYINRFCLMLRRGVIRMSTWTAGKDSMKLHWQQKKIFTIT